MHWNKLTEEQRQNFLDWFHNEWTVENGYSAEEIEDFRRTINTEFYYIEDGLTFQY